MPPLHLKVLPLSREAGHPCSAEGRRPHPRTSSHCCPTCPRSKFVPCSAPAESLCSLAGSARQRLITTTIASLVTSGNSQPFLSSSTTSPQNRLATTGSFHACASSCVSPKPSENVGRRNTSASR